MGNEDVGSVVAVQGVYRAATPPSQVGGGISTVTCHNPRPPSWDCMGCGDDWPCPTRRRELVAELGDNPWNPLFVAMAGNFLRAVQDMRATPAGMLYDRFLGWVGGALARHLSGAGLAALYDLDDVWPGEMTLTCTNVTIVERAA